MGSAESQVKTLIERLKNTEGVHQANFFFRNRGELSFEDVSEAWVGSEPDYSNGAVYVDLDLDGDLDLVTNNINSPAGVFRNQSRERAPDSTHYLRLALRGTSSNPDALGAEVYVKFGERTQFAEQYKVRGYLSSVDPVLHFGLGSEAEVDSVVVRWPDGRQTRLGRVQADQVLAVRYEDASDLGAWSKPDWNSVAVARWEVESNDARAPRHIESAYSDFSQFALAQRDLSRNGPALASLRLSPGGEDLLVVGGAAGQPTEVFGRQAEGWRLVQSLPTTREAEATCLCAFDADGDGDTDLYQGNGSTEARGRAELLRDQLFLNEGGVLTEVDPGALPDLARYSAACATADIDGDGRIDLMIGVRLDVDHYPRAAPSYWLRNTGGAFALASELELGNVTDVVLADLDRDGITDLAYVGEYVAPTIVYGLSAKPLGGERVAIGPTGWWYSLTAADLDGDGDVELLAGNVGLNSPLQASPEEPIELRVDDYDKNGALDPILTAFLHGESYPVHPRNALGRQLPRLKQQMPSYAAYAAWTRQRLPPPGPDGYTLEAEELRSLVFVNDGARVWRRLDLPRVGQIAPVRDAVLVERPGERPYLLCVENDYAVQVLDGPLDAGNGFALSLSPEGEVSVDRRAWDVRGDTRAVVRVGEEVVVGVNNGAVRRFHVSGTLEPQ